VIIVMIAAVIIAVMVIISIVPVVSIILMLVVPFAVPVAIVLRKYGRTNRQEKSQRARVKPLRCFHVLS
jgi:hypothetical protein